MRNPTFILAMVIFSLLVLFSCDSKTSLQGNENKAGENLDHIDNKHFGYHPGKDKRDSFPAYIAPYNMSLPDTVDHTDCLPPVGDQGRFNTCVAWAVGYYGVTGMHCLHEKMDGSPDSLKNQSSPSDLFVAIPDKLIGQDCKGTYFESAFKTLRERGVVSRKLAPYNDDEDNDIYIDYCNPTNGDEKKLGKVILGNLDDLDSYLNLNKVFEQYAKIDRYRRIDFNKKAIKTALAQKHLVIFAAQIGPNFTNLTHKKGKNVVFSGKKETEGAHGMVLVGYDDKKGANGAFKLVNSWGTDWGDEGYAWVDYDFFFNSFAIPDMTFSMLPEDEQGTCLHLTPWVFSDTEDDEGKRKVEFTVYNASEDTIETNPEDPQLKVLFLYVNAKDPSDYGILYRENLAKLLAPNKKLLPSDSLSSKNGTSRLSFNYKLPLITGNYHLLLMVDDEIEGGNPACNVFFASEKGSIQLTNGRPTQKGQAYAYKNQHTFKDVHLPSAKARFSDQYLDKSNDYNAAEIRRNLENDYESKQWTLKLEEYSHRKDPCRYRVAYKGNKIKLTAPVVPNGEYTWYQGKEEIKKENKHQYAFVVKEGKANYRCDIKIPSEDSDKYDWGKREGNTRSVCFVVEGIPPIGPEATISVTRGGLKESNSYRVTIVIKVGGVVKATYCGSTGQSCRTLADCSYYVGSGLFAATCKTTQTDAKCTVDIESENLGDSIELDLSGTTIILNACN